MDVGGLLVQVEPVDEVGLPLVHVDRLRVDLPEGGELVDRADHAGRPLLAGASAAPDSPAALVSRMV